MSKGKATPKRRDSERSRKKPIIPRDRKEAAKKAREELKEHRQLARQGYRDGDERYLPLRDRGPQRRFVREYVDSNIFVSEFLMPVILLILILSFVRSVRLQIFLEIFLILLFVVLLAEGTILSFKVRKALLSEFGELERGIRFYGISRMVILRVLRIPKTTIKISLRKSRGDTQKRDKRGGKE